MRLYGPAGVPVLLLVALAPAIQPLKGYDDALWVDANSPSLFVLPLTMLNQFLPVQLPITMPAASAGLEGTVVEMQVFCPHPSPSGLNPQLKLAGNAADVIVRF